MEQAFANSDSFSIACLCAAGTILRVDVHRGGDAGVPHLALDGFRIGASLYQPGSVRRLRRQRQLTKWQP